MKFDKETITVIVIAGLLILGWYMIYPKFAPKVPAQTAQTTQAVQQTSGTIPQNNAVSTPEASAPQTVTATPEQTTDAASAVPVAVVPETTVVTIENDVLKVAIDANSGGIASITLKNYQRLKNDVDEPVVIAPGAGATATYSSNLGIGRTLADVKVQIESEHAAVVTRLYSDGLEVAQSYALSNYTVSSIINLTDTAGKTITIPELVVWGAGLPPMQIIDGGTIKTERRNIDYSIAENGKLVNVDSEAAEEKFVKYAASVPVSWVASTNKYFASVLFAANPPGFDGITFSRVHYNDGTKNGYHEPASGGVWKNVIVTSSTRNYQLNYYCGPKTFENLSALGGNLTPIMHISYFSWFEFLAKPMIRFLVWLDSLVGSYGLAIILLTVIVRLVFWPVTQKANNSMRKMQKIQPELKALREKYKETPQELNARMMELYKKEGVNPLGGCLPILLQLPVFFALYSALDSAVELRHVSFLWAKDLTQPDLVGPAFDIPFLGHVGLHPLIIMMTILMFVQQKMTPSTGDPMQRKIMMSMPFIMLFMLYSLPSGLTLYWTVSQFFSIIQMKYGQIAAKRAEEREKALPKQTPNKNAK